MTMRALSCGTQVEASHSRQLVSFHAATALLAPLRPSRRRRQAGACPRTGLPPVLPAADHADLPHPALDLGRPVGNEAVLAVERSCLAHAAPASEGGPDMAIPISSPSRSATATRFSR
jgi:hypothetical protein